MIAAPRPSASGRPTLGVVIRFRDSSQTLPSVIEGLNRQSLRPDLIVGVDSGSRDNSAALLRDAGARIIDWTQPYHHPRVLNFALRHCPTDLVVVLSSHTVLQSADALEQLARAMSDSQTACASAKWDADPFYSDNVTWQELQSKGLKFGSIYSNSMGILRRALWEQVPFDESLLTMEDGAWAVEQLKRGSSARRLDLQFTHLRAGKDRAYTFAVLTFRLAAQHGLRVAWLGPRHTACAVASGWVGQLFGSPQPTEQAVAWRRQRDQFWAWLTWRWRPAPSVE
jgi:glycosyltransferase involved in cell wall biosynthesis